MRSSASTARNKRSREEEQWFDPTPRSLDAEGPERKRYRGITAIQGRESADAAPAEYGFQGPCLPPPGDSNWTRRPGLLSYTSEPGEFLEEYLEQIAAGDEVQDYKVTGLIAILVYSQWWAKAGGKERNLQPEPPNLSLFYTPDSLKARLLSLKSTQEQSYPTQEALDDPEKLAAEWQAQMDSEGETKRDPDGLAQEAAHVGAEVDTATKLYTTLSEPNSGINLESAYSGCDALIMFSGFNKIGMKKSLLSAKEGTTWISPTFISCTVCRGTASRFASTEGVLLRIRVPKDRYAEFPYFPLYKGKAACQGLAEDELLLAPFLQFTVGPRQSEQTFSGMNMMDSSFTIQPQESNVTVVDLEFNGSVANDPTKVKPPTPEEFNRIGKTELLSFIRRDYEADPQTMPYSDIGGGARRNRRRTRKKRQQKRRRRQTRGKVRRARSRHVSRRGRLRYRSKTNK